MCNSKHRKSCCKRLKLVSVQLSVTSVHQSLKKHMNSCCKGSLSYRNRYSLTIQLCIPNMTFKHHPRKLRAACHRKKTLTLCIFMYYLVLQTSTFAFRTNPANIFTTCLTERGVRYLFTTLQGHKCHYHRVYCLTIWCIVCYILPPCLR